MFFACDTDKVLEYYILYCHFRLVELLASCLGLLVSEKEDDGWITHRIGVAICSSLHIARSELNRVYHFSISNGN